MDIEKVNFLFEFKTSNNERDDFFINVFPTLDSFAKAKVLKQLQPKMKLVNSYMFRSKAKNVILEELKKEINIFLDENDIQKCVDLLPNILFYTSISINDIDSDILLKPLKKILFITKNVDVSNNQNFDKILINITKIMAYAFSYKEEYNSLKNNKNYECYEEIIYDYIDKIDKSKMLDDELVNLIVEALPAICFPKLKDKLSSKYDEEIDLRKYDYYINKMIPLENNIENFFLDIKKYKIKYGIIPEEICIYVNKFYSNNDSIMRLCNIDLLRHYLLKNGIEDTCIFYDDSIDIGTEGLASSKTLAIKNINLSIMMFHEARHVIQFSNMEQDKNYIRYNYNILKDNILSNYMDRSIYNRNHNKYLFEIDADIQGEKEYYKVLEHMNLLSEVDKTKMEKLDETEQFRISIASYLNVNGYNYEKGILFDDIIEKNQDLLTKFPVLQIEYDNFGKRKTMLDILKSLEKELDQNKRTKEEIFAISNCIFGEFYEVKDINETLNSLNKYIFKNPIILEIEKRLISELQTLIDDSKIEIGSDEPFNESRKNK